MDKREYRRNARAMIYLTACAVNGKTPDAEKLKQIDMAQLFEVCQNHILTACADYALESAGIREHEFIQAKEKAVRKIVLLDAERRKILNDMEQAHIWYMPLKGVLLKEWYPRLGMRQMSDNDILCDETKMEEIRQIFMKYGYTCNEFGKGAHDTYSKEPVLEFEMHRSLFNHRKAGAMYRYFEDVKPRLIRDENCGYGFHFRTEDFYLYFLAHGYKHFSTGGTGVRSLLDTYIFLRKFTDSLDWDYITAELQKMGIAEFEQQNRELSIHLFELKRLTDREKRLLDYYIFSGVYGTAENKFENERQRLGNGSTMQYLYKQLFPSYEHLQRVVPWVKKSKLLIPAAWAFRLVISLHRNKARLKEEYCYLWNRHIKNKK